MRKICDRDTWEANESLSGKVWLSTVVGRTGWVTLPVFDVESPELDHYLEDLTDCLEELKGRVAEIREAQESQSVTDNPRPDLLREYREATG
jgi:hypothetical protein